MGWNRPQDAVGQRIHIFGFAPLLLTVSGVVKDFHFAGMGNAIAPEVFIPVCRFISYRYFSFKLKPGNIGTTMAGLQRQWSTLLPATVLALVIVLLGVAGLLSLSIQRRMKEIAIRKVIGASIPAIIQLFVREYLPLLLIAGLVATPLAWLIMCRWLEGYVTRITITPWPFVGAILGLGLVMGALVVLQTTRAALANPVKSLKAD